MSALISRKPCAFEIPAFRRIGLTGLRPTVISRRRPPPCSVWAAWQPRAIVLAADAADEEAPGRTGRRQLNQDGDNDLEDPFKDGLNLEVTDEEMAEAEAALQELGIDNLEGFDEQEEEEEEGFDEGLDKDGPPVGQEEATEAYLQEVEARQARRQAAASSRGRDVVDDQDQDQDEYEEEGQDAEQGGEAGSAGPRGGGGAKGFPEPPGRAIFLPDLFAKAAYFLLAAGLDEGTTINGLQTVRNIHVHQVALTLAKTTSYAGGFRDFRPVKSTAIVKAKTPLLYARKVDHLTVVGFSVKVQQPKRPEWVNSLDTSGAAPVWVKGLQVEMLPATG